jgi:hypothetical protein
MAAVSGRQSPPVRRHPLAAIKARILLGRPRLLITPRLKVGLGAFGQVLAPGRLERRARGPNDGAVPLRCSPGFEQG